MNRRIQALMGLMLSVTLSGCAQKAKDCADPLILDMAGEKFMEQLSDVATKNFSSQSESVIRFIKNSTTLNFSEVTTSSYDEKIKKYSCEATLNVNLKIASEKLLSDILRDHKVPSLEMRIDNKNDRLSIPVKITSQLGSSGKEYIVTLSNAEEIMNALLLKIDLGRQHSGLKGKTLDALIEAVSQHETTVKEMSWFSFGSEEENGLRTEEKNDRRIIMNDNGDKALVRLHLSPPAGNYTYSVIFLAKNENGEWIQDAGEMVGLFASMGFSGPDHLYIEEYHHSETDARCCPSIKVTSRYTAQNGRFVVRSTETAHHTQ